MLVGLLLELSLFYMLYGIYITERLTKIVIAYFMDTIYHDKTNLYHYLLITQSKKIVNLDNFQLS